METKFGMHPLLAASINIMYFCQYLEEQGPVPDALLPDMKHLIEDPSADILQELEGSQAHKSFMSQYSTVLADLCESSPWIFPVQSCLSHQQPWAFHMLRVRGVWNYHQPRVLR